jgi:tripartite-type tricarboxylate transporter receptor subunit TctC
MKKKFAALGADLTASNPHECAAFVKSELAVWGKLMAEVGIKKE